MTPKAESYLQALFVSGLREAYYAEKKIARAYREIADLPETQNVSEAFKIQQQQTQSQIQRLERVFARLKISTQTNICPAIDGLIEQRSWIVEDYRDTQAIDAGLLAAARAIMRSRCTRPSFHGRGNSTSSTPLIFSRSLCKRNRKLKRPWPP